jgi:hypothetical protein
MVDVNTPVTNPSLVSAILMVHESNTAEHWNRVIDEMMGAHFLCPVHIDPVPTTSGEDGQNVLNVGTKMRFPMIENAEHQAYFLGFSDWDELRRWNPAENQQTLIMTYDDLAAMVLREGSGAEGFVVNPMGAVFSMDRSLIERVNIEKERRRNGGHVEITVSKETQVTLGQPKVVPTEMLQAVSGFLKTQKSVKAAFMQLMEKEGEQSYLLIVDFTGDKRPVFDGIGKSAVPHLKGMFIDIVPLDDDFGRKATEKIEPFYTKKKYGWF